MLAVARAAPVVLCVLVDAERVAPCWEAMLDTLDAVSPLIDDVCPGLAYVDMRGTPGEPRQWVAQVKALLVPYAPSTRIGAGANKFTAYAAARTRDGAICPAGEEGTFLAPLALTLLGIDERVCGRLRLLGITTLGDLARLPYGPLVRRFGKDAARWHACARGADRTPFLPRAQAIAIEASVFGEGRVEEEAQLFFALRLIVARVCADLERCGKRAGALEVTLELEDGSDRCIHMPIATPSADEATLGDVVRAKLSASTFSCAIVGVRLRAAALEEGGEAMPIFPADDVDPRRVAVTLARVEAVTGCTPQRARTKAAHALERRFAYEAFSCASEREMRCHPEPLDFARDKLHEREARVKSRDRHEETLRLHLRLLVVRGVAVTLERGAPASVDGRRVIACEGPWRIEEGWFSDARIARDEYDVVLADMARVRIYRQGSHWYLRGVYD